MTLSRRAGAPRVIDWTGERCVPWAPDIAVVYEHLHRYLWAARLVGGRRVLDLGSGEGFGSAILAGTAAEVVGVDVDGASVEHADLNYAASNLTFRRSSALDLSEFEAGGFGAVVAFEMIEHVSDHARVMAEIARVLGPDGLVVMSTPDRRAYREASAAANPFHERELSLEELAALLEAAFPHVAFWGQRTVTGSRIDALVREAPGAAVPAADFFVNRVGDEWAVAERPSPLYLVAVASRVELPDVVAASTLADFDLELLRERERAASAATALVGQLRAEVDRAGGEAGAARAEAAELRGTVEAHDEARRASARVLAEHVAATQLQLERSDADAAGARADAGAVAARLEAQREELEALRMRVRRVDESVLWRTFQSLRGRLYGAAGGEASAISQAVSWSLRASGRRFLDRRAVVPAEAGAGAPAVAGPGRPIRFPRFEAPEVTLLIAIRAHAELTERCLASILTHTVGVGYEVLLLDDDADAASKALLDRVEGAAISASASNLGFIRTINRGARAARGKWLVVMNNDVEVSHGWLPALLDCGESGEDVAVVTPKYVYPDGRLQEAGGLIWRDATGVNVGRDQDPDHCLYNYRRRTDYGSGAALMVRSAFWRDVGGFDERFLPMYYEDADLCFQAAERGLRVLYEPGAVVIHVEGATAGTDANPGAKRHQERNRPVFANKWRARLERDHLRSDITNVRRASDRHPGPHVLIIDHRVATWDRDAGSQRMLGIIKGLLAEGCHVTLLPNNLAAIEPYTAALQRLGVAVLYGQIVLHEELAALAPRLRLVVLSRPHTASAWLDTVRELAPGARVIYDTVDLHWLRETRRAGVSPESAELPPKARALRELELAMVRASDETWVVTRNEAARVAADAPRAQTRVVSLVHDIEGDVPPAEGRSGLLFVGGFEHPPNIDAATYLVREVMPLVWAELGEVRATIVGPSPPPQIRLLASSLVDVTGWVEDLGPLLRSSRLLVAPLTYGAGLKGKVTQALAAGLPVVTTPIGAEGLELTGPDQLLVAGDAEQLAQHVARAYRDDALWARLSRNGQDLVGRQCSVEVVRAQLRGAVAGTRPGPVLRAARALR